MPYQSTQELVDEAEAILFGVDNHHPLEADEHYIGVSNLIKRTAADYAQAIIDRRDEEVHPLWAYIGNTLADRAMKAMTPYRECRLEVPIPDGEGWQWIGHMDGVTFRPPGSITIEEGKAYSTVNDAQANEKAYRQAAFYLALLLRSRQESLPVADFSDDPDAEAFPLAAHQNDLELAGLSIRLWIFPRFGPGSITDEERPIKVWHPTRDELDAVYDFYRCKTLAVLESVMTGSLEAALSWDRSPRGLTEYHRELHEPPVIIEDEEAAVVAKRWAEAKTAEKAATRVVKGREEAELKAVLSDRGAVSVDGKKVSAVIGGLVVEARWPSLTHLNIQ